METEQNNLTVIRLAITTGRKAAELFIETGEFKSPYDCATVPVSQQSLFNQAWYRAYDPMIATAERNH